MIRVTVEVVPHGIESQAKVLGVMHIINDMTSGEENFGNYRVKCFNREEKRTSKVGRVFGFPRKALGFWELVLYALKELFDSDIGKALRAWYEQETRQTEEIVEKLNERKEKK